MLISGVPVRADGLSLEEPVRQLVDHRDGPETQVERGRSKFHIQT
jgi:hypothetical protein